MQNCKGPTPPYVCGPTEVQAGDRTGYECDPFSVCMTNGELRFDGECVTFEPTANPIPDGTYTAVSFVNGCIVSAGHAPLPTYTPSECASIPGGGGGGGVQDDIPISPVADNLLSMRPDGLAAQVFFRAGAGITITGGGPISDPVVITALPQAQQPVSAAATPPITVTGSGISGSALVIGMQPSPLGAGQFGEFGIDNFGRVVSYSPSQSGTVVTMSAQLPAKVDKIAENNFVISLDFVTGVQTNTYDFGRFRLTVTNYGTISDVQEIRPPLTPGSFYAPEFTTVGGVTIPAQIISYDADGNISNVQVISGGG